MGSNKCVFSIFGLFTNICTPRFSTYVWKMFVKISILTLVNHDTSTDIWRFRFSASGPSTLTNLSWAKKKATGLAPCPHLIGHHSLVSIAKSELHDSLGRQQSIQGSFLSPKDLTWSHVMLQHENTPELATPGQFVSI